MSNFVNKITEMQYNSISDFVQHYLEDIREDNYITIFADWKNTSKILSALINETTPVDIEYGTPDIIGYDREYCITVVNFDKKTEELFVERAYDNDGKRYFGALDEDDATIFIGDISDDLMELAIRDCKNIVKVLF